MGRRLLDGTSNKNISGCESTHTCALFPSKSGAREPGFLWHTKMIKIRNWDEYFEKDRTKQWKSLSWVPIPNKQGSGYRKIMREKNGLEIFACWIAIVQQASKCNPRGDLSKYNLDDLSLLTMIESAKISQAIDFLGNKIDWIEILTDTSMSVNNLDQHGKSSSDSCSVLFNSIQFNSIQEGMQGEIAELKVTTAQTEEIYGLYPRKIGRGAAVKKIAIAIKEFGFEPLREKVIEYATSVRGKEQQFIPYPATWFGQQRYKDEIEIITTGAAPPRSTYGRQEVSEEAIQRVLNWRPKED